MGDIAVIDYGVGNLLSVQRGLEYCGGKVLLTSDPEQILNATHVILPGVGAFGNAMQSLRSLGLISVIYELAQRETPLLGICLGMQLLLDESEEFGLSRGLGLIPGRVVPVPNRTFSGQIQRIPHIGWEALSKSNNCEWKNTLLQDSSEGDAVYFVHSFMALPSDPINQIAHCLYGDQRIAAVIRRGSVNGCQFHPEKSGKIGLEILKNFISQ